MAEEPRIVMRRGGLATASLVFSILEAFLICLAIFFLRLELDGAPEGVSDYIPVGLGMAICSFYVAAPMALLAVVFGIAAIVRREATSTAAAAVVLSVVLMLAFFVLVRLWTQ